MKTKQTKSRAVSGTKRNGAKPKRARPYKLRLYVAGHGPKSQTALANLRRVCDEHLAGNYKIDVVDVTKNPRLAVGDQILAVPTLVRKLPEPLRRIVGDLSDSNKLLVGLDLKQT